MAEEEGNGLEARVRKVETDVAVAQADIKALKEDLGSIKTNTTWLLRIVIGSVVLYVLKMLFEEGQAVAPKAAAVLLIF